MKVADNRIVTFKADSDSIDEQIGGMVRLASESMDGDHARDARGLLVALLLCLACWGALGFFLLR